MQSYSVREFRSGSCGSCGSGSVSVVRKLVSVRVQVFQVRVRFFRSVGFICFSSFGRDIFKFLPKKESEVSFK